MRQYFIRHGHAYEIFDWNGSDLTRPLTPEGKQKVKMASEKFFSKYPVPEQIVSSKAVRAIETAEIIASVTGATLSTTELLNPGADAETWLKVVSKYSAIKTVAFVGHETDMSDFLSFYAAESCIGIVFKKGSICHLENRLLVNLVQQKLLLD
jgi:phosphohistidine phosphatase